MKELARRVKRGKRLKIVPWRSYFFRVNIESFAFVEVRCKKSEGNAFVDQRS